MSLPSKSSREKAVLEKEKGNEAYKQKKFAAALQYYDNAIQLDSTNITFVSNKAAVCFEQKDYERCRQLCLQAVEVGRNNKADYTLIAKAFARAGSSNMKENNFHAAIESFNKSLAEHRSKDIVEKIRQCERAIAESERVAYIDPDIAQQEKEKGNALYKAGEYPEALKCYNEAIKRDPDNATLYSNRAACYMKLAEFRLALKDCDECLSKDPLFIKGHMRKGGVLEALKEYSKAVDAYQKALDIDPNHPDAATACERCLVKDYEIRNNPEEVKKRAMADPEVGRIMMDPAMKVILQQMEKDPQALQEHLKNPHVARNIQKLIDVGIISLQ